MFYPWINGHGIVLISAENEAMAVRDTRQNKGGVKCVIRQINAGMQ